MYHYLALFACESREGSFCTHYPPLLLLQPNDKSWNTQSKVFKVDRIAKMKAKRRLRMLSQPRPKTPRYVAECFRNEECTAINIHPPRTIICAVPHIILLGQPILATSVNSI